jgi:hypothetical protein
VEAASNSFSWWALVAALLHAVAGFFYLASGLIAPLWAVALLLLVWCALSWWLWHLRGSARALAVPSAAAVIWFVTLELGSRYLGWTA